MSSNPLMMGYEGSRRSGVALAMRHRLSGLSTYAIYGLKGQCAEDEHPAYASGHGPFTCHQTVTHPSSKQASVDD